MSFQPPISPKEMAERASALRTDIEDTERRLESLQSELAWYEDGLRLFGDSPPDPEVESPLPGIDPEPTQTSTNGTKPTLRNAILIVMREQPNKTRKVETVISELRQRDWLPGGVNGEHHARSMMAQMHRKGQIKRIDRGRYRLPPGSTEDS